MNYIQSGEKAGARVLSGGKAGSIQSGCYVEPTVFDYVKRDMKIVKEEIFGPVVVAAPFEDVNAVISRGNDTEYGLAASVWTKDINKAHKVAKGLNTVTALVNCHNIFDAGAPFGGYKRSGFGREMGIHALKNYTQVKNVIIQLHHSKQCQPQTSYQTRNHKTFGLKLAFSANRLTYASKFNLAGES
jgi:acyl-CoA reductase-like NAD-dependent aldehyde dehydrogenase